METPNNPAGQMTDRLMMAISDAIKPGAYNTAWTTVYNILSDVPVMSEDEIKERRTCSKLFVPKNAVSFAKCGLVKGHEGKCQKLPST